MSEVQFNNFAICDTCGVETLCRKTDGDEDECGACYWAPITHAKHEAELAALREELAALKAPGPLCFCGLKQTKNPHPEAGVPPGYLEVGTVYDCIPCLNKSRHAWSKKANRLQSELTAAEQRNVDLEKLIAEAHTWVDQNNFGGTDAYDLRDRLAAALKPTESGASE